MSMGSDDDLGGRGPSAITNAVAILRCFTVDEPSLGVTEIAARIGVHKSTVSRVLANLEAEDLVERDPVTRRFRLGVGIIAVAGPLLARLEVRRVAYPVLNGLAERTRETAALMVWDGHGAVSVEQIPSTRLIKHTAALGSRYTTTQSASVLVFLAAMADDDVRALLRSGSVIGPQHDDEALAELMDRLAAVRAEGYAVNYGLTSDDEVGIASAVQDHRGAVVAAVLVSAPRYRTPLEDVPALGTACREAADAVSGRLGGRPWRG
ncbi:IclR family transcriptional regulator [Tersicoccus solisilvae]|uniref:IclR family transcriptional regulator n=1 Tax=Tersicoccus solisilvae TaxID=1882339 RepID=A0ABQ1P9B7_9MICC|nr:IclR family transcriptional regulator [Tersicoccus solisilvae]GGC89345.1 IclR family transcriptional regulator [Tersicoccus solisilvae]